MNPRRVFACAALALAASTAASTADVITSWGFENLLSTFSVTAANSGNVASDGGTITGNASGQHAAAGSTFSSPVGNGSARSFSASNWAANDFWQFATSTMGFSGITIQWDQTSSNTGPRDFGLFYSTDGTNFFQLGANYMVLANAAPNPTWYAGTPHPEFTFGPIAAPALDNQALAVFRLVDLSAISANGGTVGTAGTDRVDNVIISGATPAPGAAALLGLGGLLAVRRRRS